MSPPGEDSRREIFHKFAKYLEVTFPLVHETLALKKINAHALLYTWQGSNLSLKPTLLMAHQDVVPVPAATIPNLDTPTFLWLF
jgi:Gly-Xaa carboxypeptidase